MSEDDQLLSSINFENRLREFSPEVVLEAVEFIEKMIINNDLNSYHNKNVKSVLDLSIASSMNICKICFVD